MSGAWDDEDFEPEAAAKAPPVTDKWDGEDEDDDIKDNWDDDDEEKKEVVTAVAAPKKKKSLKDKIAEKEAAKQREVEERQRLEAEARKLETPEERLAEKLRIQKMQEDSDLDLVKSSLLGQDSDGRSGIDAMNPTSKADFQEFHQALKEKILKCEKSPFYTSLLDGLVRDIATGLEAEDIKKLANTLNTLANEKIKAAKAKNKKKSSKVSLKKDTGPDLNDYGGGFGAEYDDFI